MRFLVPCRPSPVSSSTLPIELLFCSSLLRTELRGTDSRANKALIFRLVMHALRWLCNRLGKHSVAYVQHYLTHLGSKQLHIHSLKYRHLQISLSADERLASVSCCRLPRCSVVPCPSCVEPQSDGTPFQLYPTHHRLVNQPASTEQAPVLHHRSGATPALAFAGSAFYPVMVQSSQRAAAQLCRTASSLLQWRGMAKAVTTKLNVELLEVRSAMGGPEMRLPSLVAGVGCCRLLPPTSCCSTGFVATTRAHGPTVYRPPYCRL